MTALDSGNGEARLADAAHPLADAGDLAPVMERVGDARVVMLGEASHGTSEFYRWRHAMTERLVQEKGFDFVAVEGDWPDCYHVNRFVKDAPGAAETPRQAIQAFRRWPTWMWANAEVEDLASWMRGWNEGRATEERVGFYGLDVYSLHESLLAILHYLRRHDGESLDAARRAFRCFEPYGAEDGQEYAMSTRRGLVPSSCEDDVVNLLTEIRQRAPSFEDDVEGGFGAEQNALVARNAERYYRAMLVGGGESWNVRDRHMMETFERLMDFHGPESKGIVWAHNTHVGDARFTDMARGGMVNIGQLGREAYGEENVVLAGFTSHRGTVIAGRAWDAPWARMDVPPAMDGSSDDLLHRALGGRDGLVTWTRDEREDHPLAPERGQRAIGVVYHPEWEKPGNYVPTRMTKRYDAVLHVDESNALHPHRFAVRADEPPETWPSGF